MTRKKVKLAFITNDSARKATFKKRKKGLIKKVSELSTLCSIDACAIVYNPYEPQPDVWPDQRGAQRVVAQFKHMPQMEQSKKMVNQESFIRQRISKAVEQLKKLHKDNHEKEITHLMYECLTGKEVQGLAVAELNDIGWLIDQNMKEIYKRIEVLKSVGECKEKEKKVEVLELGGRGIVKRQQQQKQQQQQWFAEWMGSSSGGSGSFGGHNGGNGVVAEEMIMQFNDHGSIGHGGAAAVVRPDGFFS